MEKLNLTKKEYFTAVALQGIMVQAIAGSHNQNTVKWNEERAKFAVDMAEATIKELDKRTVK